MTCPRCNSMNAVLQGGCLMCGHRVSADPHDNIPSTATPLTKPARRSRRAALQRQDVIDIMAMSMADEV